MVTSLPQAITGSGDVPVDTGHRIEPEEIG